MRVRLAVSLLCALFLVACSQAPNGPSSAVNAVSPTAVSQAPAAAANLVEVPFHSELAWDKTMNEVPAGHCPRALPDGIVYLWLTHNVGTHTTTHLGTGPYENFLCVFGRVIDGKPAPVGWYAETVQWTAANGDVLLAKSEFQRWTGTPGKSVAIEAVTFQNGGTGRFRFAKGDATSYINAPERTAVYEGALRYGKTEK
jgi:hypothetical protein